MINPANCMINKIEKKKHVWKVNKDDKVEIRYFS